MKFNYLFQGELNLFTILQSCFPGFHTALSFSIVMPIFHTESLVSFLLVCFHTTVRTMTTTHCKEP